MLFEFELGGCDFHYIHNRKPSPLGTPGSQLPKHCLCVRLVANFAPKLDGYFVSHGDSGFDAADALLGEPEKCCGCRLRGMTNGLLVALRLWRGRRTNVSKSALVHVVTLVRKGEKGLSQDR